MSVRFAGYAAVLFASFAFNALGVRSGLLWYSTEPRCGYHGLDSALVLTRLRLAADGGPTLYPLADEPADGVLNPYPSQFGLQGIVLGGLQRALGADPAAVADAAALAFAALTALALAAVFAAARGLRPAAADVAVALTATAPILVALAPSLYWSAFLLLGPSALAWVAYPWAAAGPRWRKAAFVAGVGLLVLAKCLCGYEFVTTVILAPAAGVWFHQHAAADPLRRRLRWAAAAVGVGVLGFALAVGLHALQLRCVLGVDPVQTVLDRARARTLAGDGRDEVVRPADRTWTRRLPDRVRYPADCFLDYFRQPVASAPAVWTRRPVELSLGAATLGVGAAGLAVLLARRRVPREAAALTGAAAWGFAAAAAWQVLAVNHMCVHQHLNLVVFQVAFLPPAALLLGSVVAAAADRLRLGRLVGPALLVGFVVTAAVTVATARTRAAAEPAEQDRAAESVRRHLGGGAAAPPGGVAGHVDLLGDPYALHHTARVEIGLRPMLEPRDRREPLVVVSGWAIDHEAPGRGPSARVVLTADGAVVPARVVRYGLPHLDPLAGGRRAAAGFAAVVQAADVPPGAALRVFAVSAADPARVIELKLPAAR